MEGSLIWNQLLNVSCFNYNFHYSDIVDVVRELKLQNNPLIIVGHSLGGALAVHAAEKIFEGQEFSVMALVVIDVVEGSAMESLSTMHAVLKQRPKSFPSLTRAIEWA